MEQETQTIEQAINARLGSEIGSLRAKLIEAQVINEVLNEQNKQLRGALEKYEQEDATTEDIQTEVGE